ncbi:MAG: metal-dependent transcriptional regulator [Candidatus Gastranaerophilaceae bacterium]
MDTLKISATLEDYLELIYETIQEKSTIKAIDIAKKFDISRASVTEALQRLEQKGYISYGRYQPILLTDKGTNLAKEIIYKHETLQKFFISVLNLSEEEAEINACRIEHIITTTAFERIKEYVISNKL